MNDRIKVLIGAVIFVFIIIGLDKLLKTQNRGNMNVIEKEMVSKSSSDTKVIEVTEKTFEYEVLKSDKKVFIDFYASWCGPCQMFAPVVDEVSNEIDSVKFVRIDTDEENNLAEKYGIYSIPTIIIIENGKEIKRVEGYMNKNKLISFINNS